MGAPIHQNCPFKWGDLDPHVTHDALGPCKPTTQTAPQSVQPCLHRWPRCVPILYNGLPVSSSKLPLPMLASGPHVIQGSLGPPESCNANGNLIVSAVFAQLTSMTDWQSDRQTDRPRYSVRCGIIMHNYVGYGKVTHSFHVSTNNFATIKSLSGCLKFSKLFRLKSYVLCRSVALKSTIM